MVKKKVKGKKKAKGPEKERKIDSKKQIGTENKILRNLIFGIIALIILFLLLYFFINSTKNFEYKGVKFNVVKAGEVRFYHTSFPIVSNGRNIDYNVYLRKDPRKLKDVNFDGELELLEMIVLENNESFVCDGDGGIAILNFQQIVGALGAEVIKDPNATCDSLGRYTFIRLKSGDKTSIEQFGPSCYEITINNCEILDGTERFLNEILFEYYRLNN